MAKGYSILVFSSLGVVFLAGTTEGRGQEKLTPSTAPVVLPNPATAPNAVGSGEPSALSKMLAGKTFIGTGFGYTGVSGKKGDWTSAFAANVGLGYRVLENFMGGPLYGTFRYAPADVLVNHEGHNYEGMVELYNFGGLWQKSMGSFDALAAAELSIVDISLSSQDPLDEESSLESGSLNVLVGGGANWSIFEKISGGPRAYVGFGSVTYYQLGGEVSFIF